MNLKVCCGKREAGKVIEGEEEGGGPPGEVGSKENL
jgi:hypothetical protein